MVTALMIKPGEHPIITMLCDTAEYLNHAVSLGSDEICFAQARRLENGLAILHADSCASFGFPANRKVNGKLTLADNRFSKPQGEHHSIWLEYLAEAEITGNEFDAPYRVYTHHTGPVTDRDNKIR